MPTTPATAAVAVTVTAVNSAGTDTATVMLSILEM